MSNVEFIGKVSRARLSISNGPGKLVRPDLPRCTEKVLSSGAMGRVAGTPCKRPATKMYGLCATHFAQYFGHRFQRGHCSCGQDNTTVTLFCPHNGHSKRAVEILEAMKVQV